MRAFSDVNCQSIWASAKRTFVAPPNVLCLYEDLSVAEAIHTIQTAQDLEMVFYLYVVDDRHHLVGVVSLRQLLMVAPGTPLKKIMTTDVICLSRALGL